MLLKEQKCLTQMQNLTINKPKCCKFACCAIINALFTGELYYSKFVSDFSYKDTMKVFVYHR